MFRNGLAMIALVTLGLFPRAAHPQSPVTLTAGFTAPNGQQEATLFITAKLAPGYWLYSTTQPPGGPNPTVIKLEESSAFKALGPFVATQPPTREETEIPGWPLIEKHPGAITWQAPIRLAPGVDLMGLKIHGTVQAQVDTASFCIPPTDYPFTATLAQPAPAQPGSYSRHGFWRRVFF